MNTVNVLGIPLAVTTYAGAAEWCMDKADQGDRAYAVEAANTHVLALANQEEEFGEAISKFDLVCPDGVPLVWSMNRQLGDQEKLSDRVYGPSLMLAVLEATKGKAEHGHFLLGGQQSTLDKLNENFSERYPESKIAGSYSPPFGEWPSDEFEKICRLITESKAKYVWVGLGCPKQEKWIAKHLDDLPPAVYFGIGAAFAFHAGEVKQAPPFLQERGMEWLYRLCMEPRRLWKRYFTYNSLFIYYSFFAKK